MPMWDVNCPNGHEDEQFAWSLDRLQPCPICQEVVERVWRMGSMPHVIDDSVPGGFTVENMGPTPLTFYSKTEWRRTMKERGLVNNVYHVPLQGTDKSPHTTRWV